MIDVAPEPQLEHHQAPDPMAVVASAGTMFVPHLRHDVGVEDTPLAETTVEQQISDQRSERPAQPSTDRRFESVFRPVDDRRRQVPREEAAEEVLAPAPFKLERTGYGRGKLQKLVIQEGFTRFEGYGHAHPVDLGENVVHKV